jgi:hypothetical protein
VFKCKSKHVLQHSDSNFLLVVLLRQSFLLQFLLTKTAHFLALLPHLSLLFLDKLNLSGKFNLSLSEVVECVLFHVNQFLHLLHEVHGSQPIVFKDVVKHEHELIVLACPQQCLSVFRLGFPRDVRMQVHRRRES